MTSRRRPRGQGRWGGRWMLFVHRYGWRAYALPVLAAVTIAVLVRGTPAPAVPVKTADRAVAGDKASAGALTATDVRKRRTQTVTPTAHQASPSTTAGNRSGASQFEGLTDGTAGFGVGSTPAPVVVRLGDDVSSCTTNTYRQLVLVSISRQHLWACDGGKQVNSTAVTTGATVDNDQTPLGSWRVQAKQRDRYLVGPGYRDYVKYWVPFNGDFGLHDAPWQTMPFGSKDYPQHGSHGCVHLPTATMAWLYRWAVVGHTVVTVET